MELVESIMAAVNNGDLSLASRAAAMEQVRIPRFSLLFPPVECSPAQGEPAVNPELVFPLPAQVSNPLSLSASSWRP